MACNRPAREAPAAEAPSKKTGAVDGKIQAFLQKFAFVPDEFLDRIASEGAVHVEPGEDIDGY